jgi:magnesium transporter
VEAERRLALALLSAHPADAARLLEPLPADEVAAVLEEAEPRLAGAVLERMAAASAAECLTCLSPARAASQLAALRLDLAAALLRRLEPAARERVLAGAPDETADALRRLIAYPPDTAGALMDPRILVLPPDVAAGDALARLRRASRHLLDHLYVADREHALQGVVGLHELLRAPRRAPLATLMRPRVARLSAEADRTVIVAHPGWREFHALPVVDGAGRLVGVMRYETLRRLEEETAGSAPTQRALAAALALGEACVVGFSGVLADVGQAMVGPAERGGGAE